MAPLEAILSGSGSSWTATLALLDTREAAVATGASPAAALDALRLAAVDQVRAEAKAQGVTLSPEGLANASATIRTACTLALARATTTTPTLKVADPLGLGLDVSTFPDLDPQFRPLSGQRAVAEAVARRWITPLGGLVYDDTYGEDLRARLNAGVEGPRLRALEAALTTQALADERVQAAAVTLTPLGTAPAVTLRAVALLTTSAGPFRLVLTVDQLAANLEVLRA